MDLQNIQEQLNTEFAKDSTKYIFWFDDKAEYEDEVKEMRRMLTASILFMHLFQDRLMQKIRLQICIIILHRIIRTVYRRLRRRWE